ncbi:MAG: hypothetical protein ACREMD_14310 [Gemmatimonadota bacterium]
MIHGKLLGLALGAVLLTACGSENPALPTEPGTTDRALQEAASPIVASASGGVSMTLEVFGFTIPQVLGFQATKFADGEVKGHINYHQIFQGERFRFNATVTCMNVYDGNRVKFGGELLLSNDPTVPPGTFIWFQSIDNGEGAGAPADLSTGSAFGTEAENEAFCNSPTPPNPIFLAEVNGNIQVSE